MQNKNGCYIEVAICSQLFYKIGVVKHSTKFIGKDLCRRFFHKVAGLQLAILAREKLSHKCFPVNLRKSFAKAFFIEQLRRLKFLTKTLMSETLFNRLADLQTATQVFSTMKFGKFFQTIRLNNI